VARLSAHRYLPTGADVCRYLNLVQYIRLPFCGLIYVQPIHLWCMYIYVHSGHLLKKGSILCLCFCSATLPNRFFLVLSFSSFSSTWHRSSSLTFCRVNFLNNVVFVFNGWLASFIKKPVLIFPVTYCRG